MSDDIFTYASDREESSPVRCCRSGSGAGNHILAAGAASRKYIGQAGCWRHSRLPLKPPKQRGEALEHVLFHGPPSLGKTTLAHIIANRDEYQTGRDFGPAGKRRGSDRHADHPETGDVLFIDEIHRTPKAVGGTAISGHGRLFRDFIFDKGIHARSHRFQLKQFTLVGATTRVGLLSAPLRDRFGLFRSLDFYGMDDLEKIVRRSAALLKLAIDAGGAAALARRSRGTPRIINRLLKRARDYAQVRADGRITQKTVEEALNLEGVDNAGLTPLDRRYLLTIINYYNGGPVGIEAVSATLQEETDTLVDVVEPFLLKIGFLMRTAAGRRASAAACQHLGIALPEK
ncbi:MAG: Holliday junction branch migration DNA helicase RuvB [Desulfobacterales bacterium]